MRQPLSISGDLSQDLYQKHDGKKLNFTPFSLKNQFLFDSAFIV